MPNRWEPGWTPDPGPPSAWLGCMLAVMLLLALVAAAAAIRSM
jgi:hypothetical protein